MTLHGHSVRHNVLPRNSVRTTSETGLEPITLSDAKQQLKLASTEADTEVLDMIPTARAWAERIAERTFRKSVTRRWDFEAWPTVDIFFRRPPLLTVDSVKFLDVGEVLQTVDASNYHVVTPDDGKGYLQWDDQFTFPAEADRPDAIQITFTSGSNPIIPEGRAGILLLLQVLWGEDDAIRPGFGDKTLERAQQILLGISEISYA